MAGRALAAQGPGPFADQSLQDLLQRQRRMPGRGRACARRPPRTRTSAIHSYGSSVMALAGPRTLQLTTPQGDMTVAAHPSANPRAWTFVQSTPVSLRQFAGSRSLLPFLGADVIPGIAFPRSCECYRGIREGVGSTECHVFTGRCSPPVRARTADFLFGRKGSMRRSYFRRLQFASQSGSLGGTNMERRPPWHGSFCAEHGANQSLGRQASSH